MPCASADVRSSDDVIVHPKPNGSVILFHIGQELPDGCVRQCSGAGPAPPPPHCPRTPHGTSVAVADSFAGPWTRSVRSKSPLATEKLLENTDVGALGAAPCYFSVHADARAILTTSFIVSQVSVHFRQQQPNQPSAVHLSQRDDLSRDAPHCKRRVSGMAWARHRIGRPVDAGGDAGCVHAASLCSGVGRGLVYLGDGTRVPHAHPPCCRDHARVAAAPVHWLRRRALVLGGFAHLVCWRELLRPICQQLGAVRRADWWADSEASVDITAAANGACRRGRAGLSVHGGLRAASQHYRVRALLHAGPRD